MLAVLDKSLSKAAEGLRGPAPSGEENDARDVAALLHDFTEDKERQLTISLGSGAGLAWFAKNGNLLLRQFYAVVDNMFCLFEGRIDNLSNLNKYYGLHKRINEPTLVIEIYRTLRDRGPYPAEKVIRDIEGRFAFVILDMTAKSTFIAVDYDCTVPFYWGADSEERLILSDDAEFLKKACGKSFAIFPKGCFYTSTRGLRSYEHASYELKAVPWVDSHGDECWPTYEVDFETKKPTSLRRNDSDFDWSEEL
ncbi:stem-specific protein TSJT1-like [Phalaenopsis equestris]|uniref:stem-specific protein TSJT1-like n=1 Tax=Phalaenopsis equestris TaxID=78828 RepID=UPI0009E4866F|nr:stem-specific protein TSJT1-like [Phalaenopsis equestris]